MERKMRRKMEKKMWSKMRRKMAWRASRGIIMSLAKKPDEED